ncbi:MAG: M23 family metallopeptidase [Pseudomonadota bacterium]
MFHSGLLGGVCVCSNAVARRLVVATIAPAVLAGCATRGVETAPISVEPPKTEQAVITAPVLKIPTSAQFTPNGAFYLCEGYLVRNAPPTDIDRRVRDFTPFALVNGRAVVARSPVRDGCLTSGFGLRHGRMHRGIDIQAVKPATIRAAAEGRVVDAKYMRGYGLMVLLEHGDGAYSRYAHLRSFAKGVKKGAKLAFGAPLGQMGRTGRATGTHLHYEILVGQYDPALKSFGLEALDPLKLPSPDDVPPGGPGAALLAMAPGQPQHRRETG